MAAAQCGLCRTWRKTRKTVFLTLWLIYFAQVMVANTKRDGSVRDVNEEEKSLRLFVIIPKTFTEDDMKKEFSVSDDVMTLSFQTDTSGQTVQTQIRLLLEEQPDQGLHCLLFHSHHFNKIQVYLFITWCLGSIKLDRVISETRYSDLGKGGHELKLD